MKTRSKAHSRPNLTFPGGKSPLPSICLTRGRTEEADWMARGGPNEEGLGKVPDEQTEGGPEQDQVVGSIQTAEARASETSYQTSRGRV